MGQQGTLWVEDKELGLFDNISKRFGFTPTPKQEAVTGTPTATPTRSGTISAAGKNVPYTLKQ